MWVCVSTPDPWPSLYRQPLQGWWENSGRCKSQVPWYAGKGWLGKQKHWKYFGKIYHNMYLILFRSESWKTYLYADKRRSNGCLLRDFKVNNQWQVFSPKIFHRMQQMVPGLYDSVLKLLICFIGWVLWKNISQWVVRIVFFIQLEKEVSPSLRGNLVRGADHGASWLTWNG